MRFKKANPVLPIIIITGLHGWNVDRKIVLHDTLHLFFHYCTKHCTEKPSHQNKTKKINNTVTKKTTLNKISGHKMEGIKLLGYTTYLETVTCDSIPWQ